MKNVITLKKKSDPGKFAIPCLVKGIEFPHALCDTGASISILPRVMANHLGLKVEPSKESFTFVYCSQRNLRRIAETLNADWYCPSSSRFPCLRYQVEVELFFVTWKSFLVNNRSNMQHANQPVVPGAHRSACLLWSKSSYEATDVLLKNRWSRTHSSMSLWSWVRDRVIRVDQNSHTNIDWLSEIDRKSTRRIDRQFIHSSTWRLATTLLSEFCTRSRYIITASRWVWWGLWGGTSYRVSRYSCWGR